MIGYFVAVVITAIAVCGLLIKLNIDCMNKFHYDGNDPDIIHKFAKWTIAHLHRGSMPINTVYDNSFFVGQNSGVVLYRDGQLQIQLWLAKPNSEIHDHKHPNVDSYEVYFGSDVYFRKEVDRVDGVPVLEYFTHAKNVNENREIFLHAVHVPPDCVHGGNMGARGGCFLSIQHWLNGVQPTSVEHDWDGQILDNKHVVTSC